MFRGSSYRLPLTRSTVLVEMFHWVAIRAGASPSLIPLSIARRSNWDSGSVLLARGGFYAVFLILPLLAVCRDLGLYGFVVFFGSLLDASLMGS